MQVTIGKYDSATKTVPVTFEHAGVVHQRAVNACLTMGGKYDAKATAERVAAVALGVEHKIKTGAILAAPLPDTDFPAPPWDVEEVPSVVSRQGTTPASGAET